MSRLNSTYATPLLSSLVPALTHTIPLSKHRSPFLPSLATLPPHPTRSSATVAIELAREVNQLRVDQATAQHVVPSTAQEL